MDKSRLLKRIVIWKDQNLTKRKIFKFVFLVILVLIVAPFVLVLLVRQTYQAKIITSATDLSHYKVAIVFGATVNDNTPSSALLDRVDAAVNLYKAGKIEKIIMSGDGTTGEPVAMITRAKSQGVPADVLLADNDSTRTFDTCYRARNVFNLGRAVLISQPVHLLRALYICNSIGVNSVGFAATATAPEDTVHEMLGFLKAFWDVNIIMPSNISQADPLVI